MIRAFLVAGGIDGAHYDIRYRNDLGAFYKLLVHVIGIPPHQVRVCHRDGGAGDLDDDGRLEHFLPATRPELETGLRWLAEAGPEDLAILVASNHGDPDGLCLWGAGEFLPPSAVQEMLTPCAATKLLVFGQCYAGRFASIALDRTVICCACEPDQPSYAHPDKNYDSFLYHLATALAGETPDGTPPNVPLARTGPAHVAEAFRYAQESNRTPETPRLIDPLALAPTLDLRRFAR
ncbi:MAG TPA: hypothetical protein VH877_15430 [Polyangia bacterium]|jgi:hypothetical protein|nr:hypothetical protein [Polyangia bacterium]